MSVRREGETAWLEGACRVEEAEVLAGLLVGGVKAVDLSRCEAVHAAVAQVLLAWRPTVRGASDDAFLREILLPAIAGRSKEAFPSAEGIEGTEGALI